MQQRHKNHKQYFDEQACSTVFAKFLLHLQLLFDKKIK
jgi:hypothetical protein